MPNFFKASSQIHIKVLFAADHVGNPTSLGKPYTDDECWLAKGEVGVEGGEGGAERKKEGLRVGGGEGGEKKGRGKRGPD